MPPPGPSLPTRSPDAFIGTHLTHGIPGPVAGAALGELHRDAGRPAGSRPAVTWCQVPAAGAAGARHRYSGGSGELDPVPAAVGVIPG
jgi:hypothetical protein